MTFIYKITYSNGKIYIGHDSTDKINYFGSASTNGDLTPGQPRKEILWESETATPEEVARMKNELILKLRANDPSVGYNRRLKSDGQDQTTQRNRRRRADVKQP